jgi:hypothetical protein
MTKPQIGDLVLITGPKIEWTGDSHIPPYHFVGQIAHVHFITFWSSTGQYNIQLFTGDKDSNNEQYLGIFEPGTYEIIFTK